MGAFGLRRLIPAALCSLALLGVVAPEASATHAGPSVLVLTMRDGDTGGLLSVAVVACDPATGMHPDPASVCESLEPVGGDLSQLTPQPFAICPLIYQPVIATAQGIWQLRPVSYTATYPNSCVAAAESNGVFAF